MASAALFTQFSDTVGGLIKRSFKKYKTSNFAFRFCTKVTPAVFILCAGVVKLSGLVGDHIKCIKPPSDDVRPAALDQYCYVLSTYTLPHLYNSSFPEVPYFGVGPHELDNEEHVQNYQTYYQWVSFVLFFLGMLFMVPKFLWKQWEDKRVNTFCDFELGTGKLGKRHIIANDAEEEANKKYMVVASAFHKIMMANGHGFYSGAYIFCEIINFIIAVSTIFMIDSFLGHEFANYGPSVVSYLRSNNQDELIDPMNKAFPKMAKCDFHRFGPSGGLIRHDIMCVLAENIVNEKIFVFLWFYLVILCIIAGLNLVYRLLVAFVPGLRPKLITRQVKSKDRVTLGILFQRVPYADWFMLKRIADNTTHEQFSNFCINLDKVMHREDDDHFANNRRRRSSSPFSKSSVRSGGQILSPPPTYYSANERRTEMELFSTMPSDSRVPDDHEGTSFVRNRAIEPTPPLGFDKVNGGT